MKSTKKIQLQIKGDDRGSLIALDASNLPFVPQRIFYMYKTKKGVHRGVHAHKSCNELLICTSGSCKVKIDDGNKNEIVVLNSPNEGLYIPCNIWREIYDFSKNAVLMVIADSLYDIKDYIYDYKKFLEYYNIKK